MSGQLPIFLLRCFEPPRLNPKFTMRKIFLLAAVVTAIPIASFAQNTFPFQRTVTRTDRFELRPGGTVVITGAPHGSIEVIGTSVNEIEITAKIELQAASESDLDALAASTGFVTDESGIRTAIMTVGNHNKFGLKKLPKTFTKSLMTAPFSVSYVVKVPRYIDIDIEGGKGDLTIKGIEGSIRANFLESNARVEIVGGTAVVALEKGVADISFGAKGWRGRSADIQVGQGDMTVRLPTTLSADIDATVVRSGGIENEFPDLKPRDRKAVFTERSIIAKAGVGGAAMRLSVGDGKLRMEPLRNPL